MDEMISKAFKDMDPKTGMYSEDWYCIRCNKQLNADGGHPAELYAGTYNGLCYACTESGGYVERILVLDGCQVWSYPPHCPSWRRDRENAYGYTACPDCFGSGRTKQAGWCRPAEKCDRCWRRFIDHPKRRNMDWLGRAAMNAAQLVYETKLAEAAGVSKVKSKNKRNDAIVAWVEANETEALVLKAETHLRYNDARARLARLSEHWGVWKESPIPT